MPADLLASGLALTLLGMSVVFAFLSLLVLLTWCMSELVQRFGVRAPAAPGTAIADATAAAGPHAAADEELVAVTAAVNRYRQEHR